MIGWLIFLPYVAIGLVVARVVTRRWTRTIWNRHNEHGPYCNLSPRYQAPDYRSLRDMGCDCNGRPGWMTVAVLVTSVACLLWPLFLLGAPAVWFVVGGKSRIPNQEWIEKAERDLGIGDRG